MKNISFGLVVLTSVAPGLLQSQTRSVAVSFGAGPAFTDHRNTELGDQGFSAFVRVTSLRSPFLVDASILSVPQGQPIVFVTPATPCPPSSTSCGSNFIGPVTSLTVSPAVQKIESSSNTALQYRIGPSVSWLPERQTGTSAVAFGGRAGVSLLVNLGRGPGLVFSADYFRMFRGGPAPQWFVPVTFGLQL